MSENQSAEDTGRAAFAISFRGYNRRQVDSFLRKLALDLRRLLEASVAAAGLQKPYVRAGKEIADLLEHARRKALETKALAEEEADTILREAHSAARHAADDAERLKRRSKKEADALLEEARREAARLTREADNARRLAEAESGVALRDARKAAKQMRDEARKRADELQAAADFDAQERIREAEERLRRLRGAEIRLHERLQVLEQNLQVAASKSNGPGDSRDPSDEQVK